MFLLIAVGLLVIYLFPKFSKVLPATLISIIVVTILSIVIGIISGNSDTIMISDLGNLKANWPILQFPKEVLNLSTLKVILPYSISLAFVGLLESMLTLRVVDKMTDTQSNKNRECCAQGIGNLVCGFIGAMPGCAMIGQAIANVQSGGWGRLSTLVSGLVLSCLLSFGSMILGAIPLAALIAVMIFVNTSHKTEHLGRTN